MSDWRSSGLRYHALNFHLRNTFGHRVQKVSIDAGFTCPNVDGTVAIGGCTFCDNRSFFATLGSRVRCSANQLGFYEAVAGKPTGKRHVSRKLARNNSVECCHREILRDSGRIKTGDKAGLFAEEARLRGDLCSKGPTFGC